MLKTKTSPTRSEPGNVLRTSAKQLQSAALATRYQSSASVSAPGCLAVSFRRPRLLITFTDRCYQNDNQKARCIGRFAHAAAFRLALLFVVEIACTRREQS